MKKCMKEICSSRSLPLLYARVRYSTEPDADEGDYGDIAVGRPGGVDGGANGGIDGGRQCGWRWSWYG